MSQRKRWLAWRSFCTQQFTTNLEFHLSRSAADSFRPTTMPPQICSQLLILILIFLFGWFTNKWHFMGKSNVPSSRCTKTTCASFDKWIICLPIITNSCPQRLFRRQKMYLSLSLSLRLGFFSVASLFLCNDSPAIFGFRSKSSCLSVSVD